MRKYQEGDHVTVWRHSPLVEGMSRGWHKYPVGYTGVIKDFSHYRGGASIVFLEGYYVFEADIRPTCWYIKHPGIDNLTWRRLINYINDNTATSYKVNGLCEHLYYGFDGITGHTVCCSDGKSFTKNNAIELTLEEWDRFNYDRLSSVKEASSPEPTCPEKGTIISGVSIHGVSHGTEVLFIKKTEVVPWKTPKQGYIVQDLFGYSHTVRPHDFAKKDNSLTNTQTTMKEVTTITRDSLIGLMEELGKCYECQEIIKSYLDAYPYAQGSSVIILKNEHLARIPELNATQRAIVFRYITIPEEETFKLGDHFRVGGAFYVLSQTRQPFELVLINLIEGSMRGTPCKVKNVDKVSREELTQMVGFTQFRKIALTIKEQ